MCLQYASKYRGFPILKLPVERWGSTRSRKRQWARETATAKGIARNVLTHIHACVRVYVCRCVCVWSACAIAERVWGWNVQDTADMGWLRLSGSLKWKVSFANEPYKWDDILQKRPMILRSLLIGATPCPVEIMCGLEIVRALLQEPYNR